MVGYKKLALIAAGALALVGSSEVMAAPMTEGVFVSYFSQPQGRWNRGAAFIMHFVHWREDNPTWNVKNIGWVEKYSGDGGSVENPVWVYDPEANHGEGAWLDDSKIAPWKRTNIPEPSTALLIGGAMGVVALRRRAM